MIWWCCWILLLLSAGLLRGAESNWEYDLARQVSPRLGSVEREIREIEAELPGLPGVPVADQGGTGGFASLHSQSTPPQNEEYAVTVRFQKPGLVDLVALIPARRYGVAGLEPQFGLPDSFAVDLVDGDGRVVARVSELHDLWSAPIQSGYPFVFPVSPPVMAAGMKISAHKLRLGPDISETFVYAWSEAFAFEGERNIARNGIVLPSRGSPAPAPAPWQWSNPFLVDGQTTSGLPELPMDPPQNVGWMTEVLTSSNQAVSAWLEVDLGETRDFDSIRLFPAKRPTSDLPSGFGFPRKVTVSVSDRMYTSQEPLGTPQASAKMGNPGNNPVLIRLGESRGRYVKINVEEPWKVYENFPAFFALSEVEVLAGEKNIALKSAVRSSSGTGLMVDPGGQLWGVAGLTDGYGPEGKLVSDRVWLLALDRRFGLEKRRYHLQRELAGIVDDWRKGGLTAITILIGVAALLLVALPIRYRVRSKRQLAVVRDRIAGDLHDEVGSNLGSIQMLASVAESRAGESKELKRIQRIAAETVSAVRDIVWLLRPEGEHRIGTVEHLRETASIMLESHDWKFTANEAAWQCELRDDTNRHLFLYFREALHNVLRHAEAKKVAIDLTCEADEFRLSIADDGSGISQDRMESPATLSALRKRAETLEAAFSVQSGQGEGTKLALVIPLGAKGSKKRK